MLGLIKGTRSSAPNRPRSFLMIGLQKQARLLSTSALSCAAPQPKAAGPSLNAAAAPSPRSSARNLGSASGWFVLCEPAESLPGGREAAKRQKQRQIELFHLCCPHRTDWARGLDSGRYLRVGL
jgi:hypothetical protein